MDRTKRLMKTLTEEQKAHFRSLNYNVESEEDMDCLDAYDLLVFTDPDPQDQKEYLWSKIRTDDKDEMMDELVEVLEQKNKENF